MSAVVGREPELELVRRFLADAGRGVRAIHLHGEAGIGKSTVLQAALSEGARLGYRIVSTRPTEAEAQLPFAGLNDLFGDLLDDVKPDLPAPQRMALDVALLRAPPPVHNLPEPLAISLAILGLLRAATDARPLIVAVDDAPWLDSSSRSVLEFVLRRMDHEPIGLIVAQRTSGQLAGPAPVVSALPDEHIREVRVAELSLGDTHRLISGALDMNFPPTTLSRLHRASGGNPFYAIEIARALQRRGVTSLEGELRLPDTLAALVRDRIAALSQAADVVVAHASALSQPRVGVIGTAIGGDITAAGLADAIAAEVVTVDGDLVRFTHPLLAGEAYARLDDEQRRSLHRRLASAVIEPEEHARHLALAAAGPDEAVASELAGAAERAYARGALEAAAELAEHAAALTAAGGEVRTLRRVAAARYRTRAGDMARARAELEAALPDAPPGDTRAEVLVRLGEVLQLVGDWAAAEGCFSDALDQVKDIRLTIEIKDLLSGVGYITGRQWEAGAQHAADAMRLAEELGDRSVLAGTIGHFASWQYDTGLGYPSDLENRVAELEPWTDHLRAVDHPLYDLSFIWRWEGEWQKYRDAQEYLLARAERNGEYSSIPNLLKDSIELDFVAGRRLDAVLDRLDRAERLARATGQRSALTGVLHSRAFLLARLGQADEAWDVARQVGSLYMETRMLRYEANFREELGLLELSRRDPAAAHDVLRGAVPWGSDAKPALTEVMTPVHAEALIGLGRLEEARALLDRYERSPQLIWLPLSSAYPGADASRARALLCAADGDLDEATQLIEASLDAYLALGDRWEQARAQLIAGDIHRRARRRAKARSALAEAETIFDGLGSVLWAAQAREALERASAGREESGGLTPTQAQVAELAIEGLTNRQIADRLFMSPHTVEAHLSAVYRTLGLSSRRQLSQAMRDRSAQIRDSEMESDPET